MVGARRCRCWRSRRRQPRRCLSSQPTAWIPLAPGPARPIRIPGALAPLRHSHRTLMRHIRARRKAWICSRNSSQAKSGQSTLVFNWSATIQKLQSATSRQRWAEINLSCAPNSIIWKNTKPPARTQNTTRPLLEKQDNPLEADTIWRLFVRL